MNKVEFQQKLDESIRLIEEGNYQEAVDQIDLLNLDSVRDTRILQLIAKAYEKCRRYEDAEDLLLQAKEVAPRGRGTLFHLCTLAIKAGNLGDAMIYYNQFCEVAKNDSERFVLQYRIAQAENKGDDELITILENFKGEEPDDRWMYELAKLYAINDRTNEALEVCDEITLWFYNGKYVQLAKELRAYLTGEPIEEEPYPAGNEVEVQTVTRKKTEEEPEEEKEEPVETPETVIEADAWDSDGVDGELFGAGTTETETEAETESETENETETETESWTETETKPEPDGPFMEEPEIERLIPGIDPDAFSREESSAYAGMTGTPVPVEEEDRSPIGRILAELPKLAEGSRPSKEEMYRIVPEFEAIAEKVAPEVVETAKEAAEDVAVTFSETLTETPAAEFTETATETATEFAEAAAGIAATGAFAKEAAAEFTDILTEEVPAAENLTENAVKKAGAGLSEMEFDLDELDRFTQEQLQPQKAEEAVQKAEEEAARIAEEEARKAEEETARIAEEEARKAEEEAARIAEEEARKAEEEAARIAEEEARKAEEEAAKLAEETQKLEETAEQKLEETAELITEPEKVEDQAEPTEPEKAEEPAEAPETEKVEEPAGEPETEKVEEPADDAPDMETEVVAALTPEAEAKPEPAETAAPAESTEEAPEESAFAGMKVNPGPEDAYWNFVVVGERPEDTLERAKAAMKALSTREGLAEKMRMTKIPAAKLNGIQIGAAFGQFRDKMVIIENAAGLSDAQLEDFAKLLPEAERSTVLCFTDTKGNMASLFGRVSALTGAFDAVFEEADATEESIFHVILDYFDAEDAVFTEAGEAAAKEYVREELLKEGGRAEELAKEFAAKVIHTAEHGGMFGLFSGHVDDEGFLHVTDKNVRKAVKK